MGGSVSLGLWFVSIAIVSFDHRLQFLRGMEGNHAAGGDRNLLSGLGVAARTLRLVAQLEIAETGKLDPFRIFEREADLLEKRFHHVLGFALVESNLLQQQICQFGFGQSILSAGLALALLILPIVIVATREAIRAIPLVIREGAYALGATKWQTVSDHLLPYSAAGILTGVIIGLARAIGETAPIITIGALTFIAFLPPSPIKDEFPYISFEWLMAPFTVMPIQMFNWVSRPEEEFQVNAAAAGLVLVVMTLTMNGLAIYLRYRMRKNLKW